MKKTGGAYVLFTSFLVLLTASVLCLLLSAEAQGAEAEATVVDHNSYVGWLSLRTRDEQYEGDFLHVVGIIQNTGAKNIKEVRVELTFLDAEGEQIVAGPVRSMLGTYRTKEGVQIPRNLLGPGDKLPFHMVLLDENASARVASYDMSVKYTEAPEEETYKDLTFLNHRLRSRYGRNTVIGELMNSGDQPVASVSVYVAFYDAEGRIVEAEDYTTPMHIFVPGQKIVFTATSYPTEGDVTYELTTTCFRTDRIPYRVFEVLSHTSYPHDEFGYLVVEGEVANVGDQDATEVVVAADFYDEEGKPLGGYDTRIPEIRANESSPFEIIFWDEELAAEVANYIFHLSSSESTRMREPSEIMCSVSSAKITAGQAVTVSGAVTPAIEGVKITLKFTSPDGTTSTEETPTSSDGSFTHLFTPQEEGDWAVEVSWPGNDKYEGSTGSTVQFTVEEARAPALVRATPSLETASAAVAVGAGVTVGVTAVMSASGLGQQVNAALSRLKIPDSAKEFLKFYAEETFKNLTAEEVRARRRRRLLSGRELLSLTVSALVLLLTFAYVEVNGLPSFTDPPSLFSVIPYVLITVVLVFVVSELFSAVVASVLGVWCEFRIWLYGLVALIASGFGFLLPFGSPGRMDYEGELDKRKAGLTATLKILCTLVLTLPFYAFLVLGYKVIGDAGLLIATMSAFYSSFPFKPLEGEAIYRYSKPLWLSVFTAAFMLFFSNTLNLFPHTTYLFSGFLAALVFTAVLVFASGPRSIEEAQDRPEVYF